MERMYRAQILLEPDQHRRLAEIAQREGRSISDITRRLIKIGLATLEGDEILWQQRIIALEQLRQIREGTTYYTGDLIAESREEREDESDQLRTKK